MNKILIVEDEKLIQEELETLLSNAGFTVMCVTDFENTLTQIKAEMPDLILLDINLPGQNGYSLCASIRQFSDVPILFITGRNTTMDELQALTLGGDDFISKPYNIPILLARINALLKRGQAAKHIDDNTLSVNIMRIREKLRTLGGGELIQTKRGMGYKI